jgi:hypothetical protein
MGSAGKVAGKGKIQPHTRRLDQDHGVTVVGCVDLAFA